MRSNHRDTSWEAAWQLVSVLAPLAVGLPVVVLPWIYGGVQSAVQWWLVAGLVAGVAGVLLNIRLQGSRVIVPGATVLLLVGLALGTLQILPLPVRWVQAFAPRNAELWQAAGDWLTDESALDAEAAKASAGPAVDAFGHATISLYPASTRRDLALLVAALALYLLGAYFFCQSKMALGLVAVGAANGAAIAFWGLAAQLRLPLALASGAWPTESNPFATFVNKNHAAGFLNLSLALALGLAIWSFTQGRAAAAGGQLADDAARNRTGRREGRSLKTRSRPVLQGLTGWQLFAVLAVAVITAGIISSLSRGAWVAAGVAALVTGCSLGIARRGGWKILAPIAAVGLALALVLWLGQGALVTARWNTLWSQLQTPDGRWAHWRDALVSAGDFWSLGSGLGTYRFAYLLKSTTPSNVWFYHAENHYLEALVEGGWLALLLVILLIGLMGLSCRKLLAEPVGSLSYALGAAALFALVSQAVHAAVDFGLYIPSNMALFALLMGAASGMAARLTWRDNAKGMGRSHRSTIPADASWRIGFERLAADVVGRLEALQAVPVSRVSAAIGASLLLVGLFFAWSETSAAAVVEASGQGVNPVKLSRQLPTVKQLASIASLEQAASRRPDDAELRQKLAELWILSMRMKMVRKWQETWGAGRDVNNLWQHSTPLELHAWAAQLEREQRDWELNSLRQSTDVSKDLSRAARHLMAARANCPILPEVHLRLAELSRLVSGLGDEEQHLARMRELVSNDDRLLAECGFVEFQSGRQEQALADWKRAAAGSSRELVPHMLQYAVQSPALCAELEALLPDDPAYLVELAKGPFAGGEYQELRQKLLAKASALLAKRDASAERHFLAGVIHALEDKAALAIEQLTRAVELAPDQIDWRYELALALQKAGKMEAAQEQARWCWNHDPANERYEQLVRQLVHLQITTR